MSEWKVWISDSASLSYSYKCRTMQTWWLARFYVPSSPIHFYRVYFSIVWEYDLNTHILCPIDSPVPIQQSCKVYKAPHTFCEAFKMFLFFLISYNPRGPKRFSNAWDQILRVSKFFVYSADKKVNNFRIHTKTLDWIIYLNNCNIKLIIYISVCRAKITIIFSA